MVDKRSKVANEEIQTAVEYLLQTCSKHKAAAIGFVFGVDPPVLTNFGNCTGADDLALYEKLVGMTSERKATGNVLKIHVAKPS